MPLEHPSLKLEHLLPALPSSTRRSIQALAAAPRDEASAARIDAALDRWWASAGEVLAMAKVCAAAEGREPARRLVLACVRAASEVFSKAPPPSEPVLAWVDFVAQATDTTALTPALEFEMERAVGRFPGLGFDCEGPLDYEPERSYVPLKWAADAILAAVRTLKDRSWCAHAAAWSANALAVHRADEVRPSPSALRAARASLAALVREELGAPRLSR